MSETESLNHLIDNSFTENNGLANITYFRGDDGHCYPVPSEKLEMLLLTYKLSLQDFQKMTRVQSMNVDLGRVIVTKDHSTLDLDRLPVDWRGRRNGTGFVPTLGFCSDHARNLVTLELKANLLPGWEKRRNPIAEHIEEQVPDRETRFFLFTYLVASLRLDLDFKVLLFIWNPQKDSGKSLLVRILMKLLGNYCTGVQTSLFDVSREDRLLKHLYRHRYARIVFADEIGSRMRLNQSVLKQLTGERTLPSPYVRGAAEYWTPPRLFVFNTNRLFSSTTDFEDELRSRIFVVPYGVRKGPLERDSLLFEKLTTQHNLDVFLSYLVGTFL